jgi:hypothetical protein
MSDDYMSQPHEQTKQPEALAVIQKIAAAAGEERRPAVFNALWSFWNFAHAWDDLIDGSNWPEKKKELAWRALQEFTSDLLLNPFYRAHGAEIRAMFTSAIFRQIAGDKMGLSDDEQTRKIAPAVRCADIDCLVHFAYLAGGWELAHEISQLREYDKPDKEGK